MEFEYNTFGKLFHLSAPRRRRREAAGDADILRFHLILLFRPLSVSSSAADPNSVFRKKKRNFF
jgi:hypothetical protein